VVVSEIEEKGKRKRGGDLLSSSIRTVKFLKKNVLGETLYHDFVGKK